MRSSIAMGCCGIPLETCGKRRGIVKEEAVEVTHIAHIAFRQHFVRVGHLTNLTKA